LPAPLRLIVTCEHATNHLPAKYALLFADRPQIRESHCAYDLGALELARRLADRFTAPCFEAGVSRLLIDCNRSPGHRRLFCRQLEEEERHELLNGYYLPFRRKAQDAIGAVVARGETALHLSVHTFTPEMNGQERRADVALLYDPSRGPEKELCRTWLAALGKESASLRLRRNYPYRGVDDGFTSALRREFSQKQYLGIEIEVNQKFVAPPAVANWQRLQEHIANSLATVSGQSSEGGG